MVNTPITQKNPIPAFWSAKDLPAMPDFLKKIIEQASAASAVKKIVLFGSRVRGDFVPRSDYDLCFFIDDVQNWPRVVTTLEENVDTLLKVDFVLFQELDQSFQDEIRKQGVVIYERKNP